LQSAIAGCVTGVGWCDLVINCDFFNYDGHSAQRAIATAHSASTCNFDVSWPYRLGYLGGSCM